MLLKIVGEIFVNALERKRSQEEIRRQLNRLAALRSIDNAITSSFDLHVTLEVILAQVLAQLHGDAADVLLLSGPSGATGNLKYAAGRGFHSDVAARSRPNPGAGPAGRG